MTVINWHSTVVNCFQNVSLKYRAQQTLLLKWTGYRCELLSECIFEISGTTVSPFAPILTPLWIAFRMYLWNIGHNCFIWELTHLLVVNCFQNVSLKYRAQHPYFLCQYAHGCELLSECIFEISGTTFDERCKYMIGLWIAFRMYLWNIGHNDPDDYATNPFVVNCFQNVSLKYRAQQKMFSASLTPGCELLSECIFEISGTTGDPGLHDIDPLWIAFRMYLWNIGHNLDHQYSDSETVVNCFQNVSLKYRAQLLAFCTPTKNSCELLSECIFEISGTTYVWFRW